MRCYECGKAADVLFPIVLNIGKTEIMAYVCHICHDNYIEKEREKS